MPRPVTRPSVAYCSDVVAAAAGITETSAGHSVGGSSRIAHNAAKRLLQLKLLNTRLHSRLLVSAQLIQNLLRVGGDRRIGSRRIIRHVELYAVNAALGSAAALGQLGRNGVGVLQVLVTNLTNRIVSLARDSGLIVVKAANAVLQLVKAVGITQVSLGHRVAIATVTVAKSEATAAEQSKKQDPGEPRPASKAHSVIVSNRSDVAQTEIIYDTQSFQKYL